MPMDRRARSWMGFDAEFSRRLGQAGLIGLMLPEEYGGAGLGPFSRFVIVEELLSAGAPVSAHGIAERQSGPLQNGRASGRERVCQYVETSGVAVSLKKKAMQKRRLNINE